MPRYRTTRDIVIPAGTILAEPPTQSSRWGSDHEAVVGLGRDHSGYFSVDVADAAESGFIEPVEGE